MRLRARTDANHTEIVEALRSHGAQVLDLSRVGRGCPDILVHFEGKIALVEVKVGKGKLTPAQVEFQAEGWPVRVVRSVTEADQLMAALRQKGTR